MSPSFDDSDDIDPWQAKILPDGDQNILKVLYSKSQSSGVLVLVITSVFSIIAVSGLLTAIALSAWNTRKSKSPNLFVRTNVAPYFIFLLLSYFMQAIGAIMNARWVQKHAVETGSSCTAQGVIKHISDVGVAIWTLVIAIHTFCLLFYRMVIPRSAMYATIISAIGIVLLITPLGPIIYGGQNSRGNFYGISGYWCWISDQYGDARITLDYMIVFISAFLSFILYTLVFLRMRGNIVVNGWYIRFRLAKNEDWRGRDFAPGNAALSIARQMLLYPIAYTILILPIAAARFCEWTGHSVPFQVTVFCDVVFLLSGLVNVVLFYTTRRLLPAQSVFPSWRKFMPWSWFSRPAANDHPAKENTEKSFACRAAAHGGDVEKNIDTFAALREEEEDESLYLPVSNAHESFRVKIDNHVDTMLTDAPDESARSSVASSFDIGVGPEKDRPPPTALVMDARLFSKGDRSSSGCSETTIS